MLDKQGVILVMFDLPSKEKDEKKAYRTFIKKLKENGYVMFQESIYLKLVRSLSNLEGEIRKINTVVNPNANISVLPLKLKDFIAIRTIKGVGIDLERLTGNVINI